MGTHPDQAFQREDEEAATQPAVGKGMLVAGSQGQHPRQANA